MPGDAAVMSLLPNTYIFCAFLLSQGSTFLSKFNSLAVCDSLSSSGLKSVDAHDLATTNHLER